MCDVSEIADGGRDEIKGSRHVDIIKDKGPGAEPRPFVGLTSGLQAEVRCGLIPREWNSAPPIVVTIVAIAIVAVVTAPIVVTVAAVATVSKTVDAADVAKLLLDLRPLGSSPAIKAAP